MRNRTLLHKILDGELCLQYWRPNALMKSELGSTSEFCEKKINLINKRPAEAKISLLVYLRVIPQQWKQFSERRAKALSVKYRRQSVHLANLFVVLGPHVHHDKETRAPHRVAYVIQLIISRQSQYIVDFGRQVVQTQLIDTKN